MYMAGTALGCALFGVSPESLEAIDWSLHGRAFYEALWEGLRPLVVPFVVGNTVLGVIAGPRRLRARAVAARAPAARRRGASGLRRGRSGPGLEGRRELEAGRGFEGAGGAQEGDLVEGAAQQLEAHGQARRRGHRAPRCRGCPPGWRGP